MNDHIAKPIDPQIMVAVLKTWLGAGLNEEPAPQVVTKTAQVEEPIFIRQELLERLLGDEQLLQTIIDGFLQDLPKRLQALEEGLAADDAATVRGQAHAIKGAAANVSAPALKRVAYQLEQAGETADLAGAEKLLKNLYQQVDLLKAQLC
jgi:HPt (histidine-containing phosphotransfer) domain-containing protein